MTIHINESVYLFVKVWKMYISLHTPGKSSIKLQIKVIMKHGFNNLFQTTKQIYNGNKYVLMY